MAKLIKIVAILLVVLPALIAANEHNGNNGCQLSVTSKLKDTQNRYNEYTGTINNIGTETAADVLVNPSVDLHSVSGLKEKNSGYSLLNAQKQAGIAAGSSYDFTYTVAKGKNVRWSASCTDAASSATTAPTTGASNPTTPVGTAPPTAPAGQATAAPTTAPTTAPATTSKATSAATTHKATSAPATSKATSAPATQKATSAPATSKATSAPSTTGKTATVAPTTKTGTSAPSPSGRVCPTGTWWAPAPQTTYQWQLTGTIDTSYNVQMYDIDLFDNTAATISTLHSQGRVVICYFSSQYENWRSDASSFTSAVLGNNLDDWAGEKYVDIRSTVVRNIILERLNLAVSKGCDGVEPDNVDSYEASSGFPLTAADQLAFNRFIATSAHAVGLSVGLKNDLDQSTALEPSFDWALNEQCNEYDECDGLNNFISKGKAVFNTEYSGSAASICPKMVAAKFTTLLKSLDLDASIKAQCCTYETSSCAPQPHQCVSTVLARDVEEQEVFAVKALETNELTTQEVPAVVVNSATASYASIAFVVVVAAVAALSS